MEKEAKTEARGGDGTGKIVKKPCDARATRPLGREHQPGTLAPEEGLQQDGVLPPVRMAGSQTLSAGQTLSAQRSGDNSVLPHHPEVHE